MKQFFRLLVACLLLGPELLSGQTMNIGGTVLDTVAKAPLPYAVAMAIRIKDSSLVAFTRSDETGRFDFHNLPIDTVEVLVTSPKFGDQSYYVFGSPQNHDFDFGKIILPPKTQQLKEVVIYAFKDPVYYKGDTLVYTADSFKVKPNATVEDLLKKLPGMRVDAQGKITAQGKEISQVLVDGDEFFGSDPTVATRNLAASGVESVQVYEKKNDNAGSDGDETIQVMNLQLKEDAKKGYFGKLSASSDFEKYHEGEVLANMFKGSRKISVFGLASNTPTTGFGWNDMYKYGLEADNMSTDEDGTTWYFNNNKVNGIPQTYKGGFYYNDKLGKKTKIGVNYTYTNKQLIDGSEVRSQYFLTDTNYITKNTSSNKQVSEAHALNFSISQKIDSLSDLNVDLKFNVNSGRQNNQQLMQYLNTDDTLSHQTGILNDNKAKGYSLTGKAYYTKRFKKKDRLFTAQYNYTQNQDKSNGLLQSQSLWLTDAVNNDTIDQKKEKMGISQNHLATIAYTEPLTKKWKLDMEYQLNYSASSQTKDAYNLIDGAYTAYDSSYSSDFENSRFSNRLTAKLYYEVKKFTIGAGVRARNVSIQNSDVVNNRNVNQSVNNLLPLFWYMYKFNENTRLNFKYSTNSNQPSMDQLQPVPDNSNPNQLIVGNPDLLPTFENRFSLNFNTYKPISGKYLWSNLNFTLSDNAFANSITYDSLGRTLSKTINTNGNYNGSFYMGGGYPIVPQLLTINPSVNGNYSSTSGEINSQKNTNQNQNYTGELGLDLELDTLTFGVSYSYSYSQSRNSISNRNVVSDDQTLSANLDLKLPLKMKIETDLNYTVNNRKTEGYNLEYTIWNASLSKSFLKNENLIVKLSVNDLLNQNINNTRNAQDNVITDTKTKVIGRYFLVNLVFKFNNTNSKDSDDNMW